MQKQLVEDDEGGWIDGHILKIFCGHPHYMVSDVETHYCQKLNS